MQQVNFLNNILHVIFYFRYFLGISSTKVNKMCHFSGDKKTNASNIMTQRPLNVGGLTSCDCPGWWITSLCCNIVWVIFISILHRNTLGKRHSVCFYELALEKHLRCSGNDARSSSQCYVEKFISSKLSDYYL